jgi:hypothetical protein
MTQKAGERRMPADIRVPASTPYLLLGLVKTPVFSKHCPLLTLFRPSFLSKLSIQSSKDPKGQIQLQKTLPNTRVKTIKTRPERTTPKIRVLEAILNWNMPRVQVKTCLSPKEKAHTAPVIKRTKKMKKTIWEMSLNFTIFFDFI